VVIVGLSNQLHSIMLKSWSSSSEWYAHKESTQVLLFANCYYYCCIDSYTDRLEYHSTNKPTDRPLDRPKLTRLQ